MRRFLGRIVAILLAGAIVWLNVDYWRDPPYWRRWWDTMTHLAPDYLNLRPLEAVVARSTAALPRAGRPQRSISDEALRAAEAYAADFDSFALIVVHRGFVQTEWYRDDWTPGRPTQSQSMHKTVVALLIGAAIADGHIASLDDPIGLYLEEWRGDARGRITIRNLLNMSSGLGRYGFSLNPFAANTAFRFLFSADRDSVVLATPLAWEPGRRFEYNDVNAQLAGMIVERATARRYADYLAERLWDPLAAPAARVWLDRDGGRAMTACCLLAPAMAWASLGVALSDGGMLDGRQVVPARWIGEMTRPSARNAGYGLFTWLGAGIAEDSLPSPTEISQSEPFVAADVFMLLGHGGQRVYVSPSLELVVVRLGPFNGFEPLKPGWDNARLFNLVARGLP